ncbi:CfaE/CblD family pilus tip adhesin [Vibrio harveyi]|uniref:CfaE/CblD family pilus tip adhesin n=1 Tax=Vibrio harveyi TaxID=669 RepID=UPI003CED95D1
MKLLTKFIFVFVLFSNSALADNWGDNVRLNFNQPMDKANITDITFQDQSIHREKAGTQASFRCTSSDICPDYFAGYQVKGRTPVKVTFRSSQGLVRILTIQSSIYAAGCTYNEYLLNSSGNCSSNYIGLFFRLNRSEVSKLDFGSVWKMDELMLVMCRTENCVGQGVLSVNITINVTDNNNAQIYIPSSGSSTTNVNLKLETYNSQYLKGEQSIGICVYDGHDSKPGSLFDMSMTGTINSKNEFAIVHDSGDEIPIDMFVTFPDGGGNIIRPSRSFSYSTKGHDSVVMGLPGVDTPVYCIPMDINFKVSPFLKNNKSSGVYNGSFNLKFNATLY